MISSLLLATVIQAEMAKPPRGAVILFDGKDASAWVQAKDGSPCRWNLIDGTLEVNAGSDSIRTKQEFGDFKLHIEFWLPKELDKKGQGRANSGVYSHGRYEIQVLDSFENPTYPFGGVGALYAQKDPDKNAIKPPEEWNTYEIEFKAPRFESDGKVKSPPMISVIHNGVKIHDKVTITKYFDEAMKETPWTSLGKGPILLQNHGSKVRYRNIWIQPKK